MSTSPVPVVPSVDAHPPGQPVGASASSGQPVGFSSSPGLFESSDLPASLDSFGQPVGIPVSPDSSGQPVGASISSDSSDSSDSIRSLADRSPTRFFLTLLQMSALGVIGWGALATVITLTALGFSLLLLAGIGIFFLIALVYVLYGLGAFETIRVASLYDLQVQPLRLHRPAASGIKGYVVSLGRQLSDGRMWAGLASLLVTTLFGAFFLSALQSALTNLVVGISQITLLAGPSEEYYWVTQGWGGIFPVDFPANTPPWIVWGGPFWTLGAFVLMLLLADALVYLTRLINISIIGGADRAKRLSAEAQASAESARVAEAAAEAQSVQRTGAVRAADVERSRIERDLHDGVQPRLVSIGMTLGLAQQQIDKDPQKAKELVAEAHASTKAAVTELRQLARGIHASVLDDRGLDAALSALAGRSVVPIALDVRMYGPTGHPVDRVSREAETAVYFAIAESLTNAAKHSRAEMCRVTVRLRPPHPDRPEVGPVILWVRVEDNGVGGARIVPGGGLDGIVNRVLAAGGTVTLDSPVGGPTALEVSVPCAF